MAPVVSTTALEDEGGKVELDVLTAVEIVDDDVGVGKIELEVAEDDERRIEVEALVDMLPVIVAARYVASGSLLGMQENQRRVGKSLAIHVCQ